MQRGAAEAVSPIVGTILMLAIVVAVIAIVFSVAVPQFRRLEATSKAATAESMMQRLEAAIEDLRVTATSRSTQVRLDLPEGGLFATRNRTRWAIWSMAPDTTDERYNLTLLDFADGDGVYDVRTEDVVGAAAGDAIQVNHTRWRAGRRTDLGTVTGWQIPAPGSTRQVSIAPEDLAGGLHEIVFYNGSSGEELATAWVMDAASVTWQGALYTGSFRYEVLHGAMVSDEPDTDARLTGFEAIRATNGSPASMAWTSIRLDLPHDASPTAGTGPATIPLTARPARSLHDGVRGNVTVAFRGNHSRLFRDAAVNGTDLTFRPGPPRGVLLGEADLAATDHLVVMPEGLVRG